VAQVARPWLIPPCYTSNSGNTTDLRSIPPVISKIAHDTPKIEGIACFSSGSRPTGWDDHPEVHADWQAVFDGITGPGVVPVPPEPIPIPPIPIPPTPGQTFPSAKELSMDEYGPGIVYDCVFCDDPFVGPKYGRVDPNGRLDSNGNKVLLFDQVTPNDQTALEITRPDTYFQERFIASDVIITHLGSLDALVGTKARCFETRPTGARGGSESPMIVKMPDKDGFFLSTVPYLAGNNQWYWSMGLTLVRR
jgi:hypothetical protein